MQRINSLLLLELLRQAAAQPPRSTGAATADPLAVLLAATIAGNGRSGPPKKTDPARQRALKMTLRQFCTDCYLPGKGHAANGATARLARTALDYARRFAGSDPALGQCRARWFDSFRDWLGGLVSAGKLSGQTANKHLRHLRAIVNYAAKRRLVRRLPEIEPLPEEPPDVNAWTAGELDRLVTAARQVTGQVGQSPSAVWWTAWLLVLYYTGARIGAAMALRWCDYDRDAATILLRAETQKQKRDQRIWLPPDAVQALERLRAALGEAADGQSALLPWPRDPANPTTGKRNWKALQRHFRLKLLAPAGVPDEKGVCTRKFRRTTATVLDELGGNAQLQLGHSTPRMTERYKDRRRMRVSREAAVMPRPGASRQLALF